MQRKTDAASFYRRIMGDAWRITWQHKHLWVFGFFTALTGFGGISEVFFNASRRVSEWFPLLVSGKSPLYMVPGMTTMRAIISFSTYPMLSLTVFLAVIGLFTLVFLWMTMVSIGALISSTRRIEKGGDQNFADGIKSGAEKFWTVLIVNLLAKLFVFCSFILAGATLFTLMRDRTMASGIFYVGTFVVFTLLALCASVIAVYATNGAVVKNESVEKSIASGWRLMAQHWLVSLEMSFFLFLAGVAFGLVAILAALVLSIPVIFLMMLSALLKTSVLASGILIVAGTAFVVLIVVSAACLTTFQTVAWTLLWGELTDRKPIAKLLRFVRRQ